MKIILTDNSYSIDGNKAEILSGLATLIVDQVDVGNFTKADVDTLVRIITSSKEDLRKEVDKKKEQLNTLMKKIEKVFDINFEVLAKRVMDGEDINAVADEVTKDIFREEIK